MRRKAIIGLVFIVASAVLVESWHAAANAAAAGGRPWPGLWPVTLEAFIFVLVLVYWDARSTRRNAPMARVLLAVTTGVASAVQILDAPPTWLGWVTAGWTPIALLLSVEFAVWLLYGATVEVPASDTPLPPGPEHLVQTRPGAVPHRQRRPRPAAPGRPTLPKKHQQALDRAKKNGGPAEVERVMVERGLERAVVAARPERWPLPSQNGNVHA